MFQLCIFPGLGDWMSGYTDKLRSQADLHTLLAYQNASCNGQVKNLSNYTLFCGMVQFLVVQWKTVSVTILSTILLLLGKESV